MRMTVRYRQKYHYELIIEVPILFNEGNYAEKTHL